MKLVVDPDVSRATACATTRRPSSSSSTTAVRDSAGDGEVPDALPAVAEKAVSDARRALSLR
jgi:hypothetical protein